MKIAVVGAGLAGLTIAKLFRNHGDKVIVFEKDSKIGGACQDFWDKKGQCWVSTYGPHILHFRKETKQAENFLLSNTKLSKFNHRVLALGNSGFTMWPANSTYEKLHTLLNPHKSFFDEYISSYSNKMWGKHWNNIKDKVMKRFKTKTNFNTSFFEGQDVYLPENGYTNLFKDLAKGSDIKLNYNIDNSIFLNDFDLVICTAPIDEICKNVFGELDWQGIDFTFKILKTNGDDLLPTPVVNLNTHPKYTRITEYNQFNSKVKCSNKVIGFEVPSNHNKLYPINSSKNSNLLKKYQHRVKLKSNNIIFHGRLGEYKYYDMDQVIQASIDLFSKLIILKGGIKNEE